MFNLCNVIFDSARKFVNNISAKENIISCDIFVETKFSVVKLRREKKCLENGEHDRSMCVEVFFN